MAIKTKYKMPKEGNQVKVTFGTGKTKVVKEVYAVLDKNGEIDVAKTEARIEFVGTTIEVPATVEEVIETPVEEVTVEEVIEEAAEKECCDDVCEDCE